MFIVQFDFFFFELTGQVLAYFSLFLWFSLMMLYFLLPWLFLALYCSSSLKYIDKALKSELNVFSSREDLCLIFVSCFGCYEPWITENKFPVFLLVSPAPSSHPLEVKLGTGKFVSESLLPQSVALRGPGLMCKLYFIRILSLRVHGPKLQSLWPPWNQRSSLSSLANAFRAMGSCISELPATS